MTAYITDIAKSVKAGADDTALNLVIQDYLDTEYRGFSATVAEWRLEKWEFLRICDYPLIGELADAQVKLSSTDPIIQAEGQAQLDQYYTDCLAVKARFPKE